MTVAPPVSPFAKPDWARGSSDKGKPLLPPVAADELIDADGRCAGGKPATAATVATAASESETSTAGSPDAPPMSGIGDMPTVVGGIGLGMSECEVTRRAGFPDNVNVGAEGDERSVTLAYMRGTWPGIYRFRAGRLVSIERVAMPEPEKPKKPGKKPTKPVSPKVSTRQNPS